MSGISRTGAWALLEQISMPTLQLALTAPLIFSLGLTGYGLWSFNLSLAGILGAATPGVAMAATQLISSEADPTRRSAAIGLIVFGGLGVSVLSSIVALALSGAVLHYYPPLVWVENHLNVAKFTSLAALTAASLQWDMMCAATLRAQSRFRENALCEISTRIFSIICLASAGVLGASLIYLLIINLLCTVMRGGVKAIVAMRGIHGYSIQLAVSLVPQAVHFSLLQWVNNLSSLLYSSADRIVLGYFVPAGTVAIASLCGEMNQQIQSLPRAYFSPILPELIRLNRSQDRNGFAGLVESGAKKLGRIVLFLSISSLACGPFLVMALTQSGLGYTDVIGIYSSYAVSYAAIAMIIIPYFSLIGRGELQYANLLTIGGAVANLVAALVLGSLAGAVGVALGRVFYTVPFMIWRKRART
ncbi:hypothetical protein [Mesorhizobium sp. M0130]|uniref:lipopolysaccharide biosynthesis protein n=1 Tax=Mesorhizobium sp. M0130 TaxID=2956887 RepID=UPI00333D7898